LARSPGGRPGPTRGQAPPPRAARRGAPPRAAAEPIPSSRSGEAYRSLPSRPGYELRTRARTQVSTRRGDQPRPSPPPGVWGQGGGGALAPALRSVQLDDPLDRPPAHLAERHRVAA